MKCPECKKGFLIRRNSSYETYTTFSCSECEEGWNSDGFFREFKEEIKQYKKEYAAMSAMKYESLVLPDSKSIGDKINKCVQELSGEWRVVNFYPESEHWVVLLERTEKLSYLFQGMKT